MISGISVVIPAFNEEKFLPDTLESIQKARDAFHQKFNLPSEVIVVNNGSTDETPAVATALGARVVDHEKRNIASVRNAGIQAAIFDLIVTVDADGFVPANAFTEIFRVMSTGIYVGGGVRTAMQSERTVLKGLLFIVDRLILHGFGISAGMFFFWKSAASRIRGFPEEFLVAEDCVFALLLRREGRKSGLRFCNLNSVRLITRDRKKLSTGEVLGTLWHVLRQLLGRKVTQKQLSYWYDPDR